MLCQIGQSLPNASSLFPYIRSALDREASIRPSNFVKFCLKTKIPYELTLCKRIIHTAPQVNLDKKQREQNLRDAFHSQLAHYQHITLVDDLLTTGSTAKELARVLKQQGAVQVDLWCCARAH